MKKLISAVLIGAAFSGAAHAGFSMGMTGAFKKQAAKLDEKKTQKNAALLLAQTPTKPTNLTAVAVSSTQINLSWTASTDDIGVTNYKIYRNAVQIAAPAGTTYSDTGRTASTLYSYTVSACDAAGNCSAQSSAASDTTAPPLPVAGGEWIFVPGNSSFGTDDFYVMKYEAKNVGGATSQAAITPWVNIDLPTSIAACSALGSGYHLLTIAETQTINRNIEAQTANWADGTIGSLVSAGGGLKRGNVGITDSASYNAGAVEYGVRSADAIAKAKLVFSNGGEIWDWSGNVIEWIYGAGTSGTLGAPGGVAFDTGGWYEWDSTSPDLSQERAVLGPSNSSWTSAYGIGYYWGGATTNGVLRSGAWDVDPDAGVFAFNADNPPSDSNSTQGFRCGWATPDIQAPTVPTNLAAVAVSSTQINLSWTASVDNVGIESYKIYRDGGVTPIAAPTGTTYSDTGLTGSTPYSYTVKACDAANNCSAQSSAASATTAEALWLLVPGNSLLGTSDFYVMKYEAKNVGGVATSQAAVTPWAQAYLPTAISACTALGSGYHLLTIAEAQTINRNIEAQAANWANGTIGSLVSSGGGLKRGNVGITDSASYGGGTAVEFGAGRNAKAKLVLSNGGEIWDWSGNMNEWIYGAGANGTLGTPGGVTFFNSGPAEWNSISPDLNQERPILGPSNSSWTSLYGMGAYNGGTTTDGVVRGGNWQSGAGSGVFAYYAHYGPSSYTDASYGFRCGWATPDTQAPTVPASLAAVAVSSTQIDLSWTASTDDVGVTSYKVYRDGGVTPIATPTGTTYSNTGLAVVTNYSYTVSACDAAGNCSAQSTAANATTPDTQAPTVPANLTAVAVSSTQINLSWTASTDDVGVTSYKIYRNTAQIAAPAGTIYSDTGLMGSTLYSYTVSACDAANNCSAQSSAVYDTTLPGGEWLLVPGNSSFGTSDFYVMKYEAKNVGSIATSQADVTPWVNINQPAAIAACSALGSGSHLLTIAEAQTINRNIEAQTANWADGIIGSRVSTNGGLKRGNVGLDDSAGYNIGTNPDYGTTPSADRTLKARLVLSNGEEIWDWSGNVWEWIYGAGANGTLGTPSGVTFYINDTNWHEWNSVSPDLSPERPVLGPSDSTWSGVTGVGSYYGGATTNGVLRGGTWGAAYAGVFALLANSPLSTVDPTAGFRCGRSTQTAASVSVTINPGYGIFFETGQVAAAVSNPDMRNGPADVVNFRPTGYGSGEVKYKAIPGCTGIANITSVDITGYTSPSGPTGSAVTGACYSAYLPNATYAAFEITGTSPMVIRYKYQPNGTNLF